MPAPLIGAAAFAGFGALMLAALWLGYMVRKSLAPERVREQSTPADLGIGYFDVVVPTANRKQLHGWWLPQLGLPGAPAAVVLHGWGGSAGAMLLLAPALHAAGIAVLMLDARCHGASDEDDFTSLPRFAEDLDAALDWLLNLPGGNPKQVAVIGHSVGAGAALLVASRRRDVAAAVSIAAFMHPVAMMKRWFVARRIPYRPFGWLILRYVEHVIGHRFDAIAPINTIARVHCPTLLLHGAEDRIVPVAEARAIHAARRGEHVLLRIVAGGHDDFAAQAGINGELAMMAGFLADAMRRMPPDAKIVAGDGPSQRPSDGR